VKTVSGTLSLSPEYVERIRKRHSQLLQGRLTESAKSKSDYWVEHSALAKIEFVSDGVILSGSSGFYAPPKAGAFNYLLRDWTQKSYKTIVLLFDKMLHLSAPHGFNSSVTYMMAYDYLMQGHPAIDYDQNPSCFNPLELKPLFKTSKELRAHWFLSGQYLAHAAIVESAYYHAMFTHFLTGGAKRYLEIGAGNGNLASFFKHYERSNVVIIDLPETILFSCCYLKSIFPDSKVLLPNEISYPLADDVVDEHDFIFLLPSQISLLPKKAFDIVVNTSSMQEMTHAQIDEYFNLVQEVCKEQGLWCNVNRVEKFPSNEERAVRAFQFPYRKSNVILVDQVDRYFRFLKADDSVIHIERVYSE